MREIPGSAESSCTDSISRCSSAKCTAGEVGAKGGGERGSACETADVRDDIGGSVGTDVGLKAGPNGRDEGSGSSGGEVATASLSDSRNPINRLSSIDARIRWLISKRGVLIGFW